MPRARHRLLRSGVAASLLLLAAAAVVRPRSAVTLAMLNAHGGTGGGFRAGHGSIHVTPGVTDLGTLHVGDKCYDVLVATVTSNWPATLSVSASGWLTDKDVTVVPQSIGAGGTARVYFTNAAVNGPTTDLGTITVTASPGGLTRVIALQGRVENPADPEVHDPDPLPPGCVHPAGKPEKEPDQPETTQEG